MPGPKKKKSSFIGCAAPFLHEDPATLWRWMPRYRSIVGSLAHEESSQNALVQQQLALHAYHLIMAALYRPICGGSVVLDRLWRFDHVFGPRHIRSTPGYQNANIANQLLLFKHQATPSTHHSSSPLPRLRILRLVVHGIEA